MRQLALCSPLHGRTGLIIRSGTYQTPACHLTYSVTQLIGAVVTHIVNTAAKRGGILIFLPGVQEIRQCMDAVKQSIGGKADIFPLHANLSSDEQRRVFASTSRWKVIAATNVAEARHRLSMLL